jgi:hypothetical protein
MPNGKQSCGGSDQLSDRFVVAVDDHDLAFLHEFKEAGELAFRFAHVDLRIAWPGRVSGKPSNSSGNSHQSGLSLQLRIRHSTW